MNARGSSLRDDLPFAQSNALIGMRLLWCWILVGVATASTKIVTASISYNIAVQGGNALYLAPGVYSPDLTQAMDFLAVHVGLEAFSGVRHSSTTTTRRESNVLTVETPSYITSVVSKTCPAGVGPNDACQKVTASVPLQLSTTTSNQTDLTIQFLDALDTAIQSGEFQIYLMMVDPRTVVNILSQNVLPPATLAPTTAIQAMHGSFTSNRLSLGAIVTIVGVSCCLALVLIPVIIFLLVRRWRSQQQVADEIKHQTTTAEGVL
jgi:hypothetical protein